MDIVLLLSDGNLVVAKEDGKVLKIELQTTGENLIKGQHIFKENDKTFFVNGDGSVFELHRDYESFSNYGSILIEPFLFHFFQPSFHICSLNAVKKGCLLFTSFRDATPKLQLMQNSSIALIKGFEKFKWIDTVYRNNSGIQLFGVSNESKSDNYCNQIARMEIDGEDYSEKYFETCSVEIVYRALGFEGEKIRPPIITRAMSCGEKEVLVCFGESYTEYDTEWNEYKVNPYDYTGFMILTYENGSFDVKSVFENSTYLASFRDKQETKIVYANWEIVDGVRRITGSNLFCMGIDGGATKKFKFPENEPRKFVSSIKIGCSYVNDASCYFAAIESQSGTSNLEAKFFRSENLECWTSIETESMG